MVETLICYEFSDGNRAYFSQGNPKNHVLVKPNETLVPKVLPKKTESKRLEITYLQWFETLTK